MRNVIIGYGMAGARLVSHLAARDPHADITVLGEEPHQAYNRILLPNLLAGTVREPDLRLAEPAGRRVRLRLGEAAVGIDRAARTVCTSSGATVKYDRLVLATGSRSALPPIKGLVRDDGSLPNRVVALRNLDDCRRILALAGTARHVLVLGGGLLGLEVARGLATRAIPVTVLHGAGHLMERQLDPRASAILANTIVGLGVEVELDVTTVEIQAGPDQVEALLADGRRLGGQLLVVACGDRPATDLAEAAGLRVDRAVVVDDRMRTSDPRIYAIGDCAQHDGVVAGLVAPAWEQASVAADVISRNRPLTRYRPRPMVTRLKAAGIDLASMGDSTGLDGTAITFADPGRATYAKLVVREQRLAGAIMLGDNPAVGTVIQLFDQGGRVPADVRSLLLGHQRRIDGSPVLSAGSAHGHAEWLRAAEGATIPREG